MFLYFEQISLILLLKYKCAYKKYLSLRKQKMILVFLIILPICFMFTAKYKIEGLSMAHEEESSVDVSSPRDVNSPLVNFLLFFILQSHHKRLQQFQE